MITVLWFVMPSTTFTFFINPGLFMKTKSRILLAFPCLRVDSLTCWISPCSSTTESRFGSNYTISTVRCDMVMFPVYVKKVEIASIYNIMCVYLLS